MPAISFRRARSLPKFPALLLPLTVALLAAAFFAPGSLRTPSASAADKGPGSDCCLYTISGTVWYDQNGNGINDSEPPLAGWTVQVCNTSNVVIATTTTNGSGQYTFNTPAGCGVNVRIKQVVQSGWTQTYPPSNGFHPVFVTGCGNSYGPFDFGNNTNACPPFTKTYTLDADFNLGTLNGVITNSDQLELSPTPTTWPYAWIANAGDGSVSKVDTQTGNEVARYYTGPIDNTNSNYAYLNPSRTVIDKDGNCWVANRSLGPLPSITQIALSGGIDRNNNNVIDTSQDLNNNGIIDPSEILPWGQDERVLRHYALGSTLNGQARGMVIDKTGFLWVGLSNAFTIVKVNPNLSTVTYAPTNTPVVAPSLVTVPVPLSQWAYGMALAPNGMIYVSMISSRAYQLDPGIASGGTGAGPAFTEHINHGGMNYGIAVDKDCIVWIAMYSHPSGSICVRWDPPLTAGNPLNGFTLNTGSVSGGGRGICVDNSGDVWVAVNSWPDSVARFSPTPNPPLTGLYPTGSVTPVGVGVASDGNIIVTPNNSSNWEKLNAVTGANIPLAGPQLAGLGPYTYSDFTGSQQALTGLQQGTWTVITDGGYPAIVWNFLGWNSLVPALTSVQVEYRVAATIPGLNTQSWITQGAPGSLLAPGRYIETRVRLQRTPEGCHDPFVTPILYDLTVSAICDSCSFAQCPADTVIQCMTPQGAEFSYPTPILNGLCDSTYVVTCTPPSPTFLPMGTTQIKCIAVNAQNDTVRCSFNVTVAGDCNPPPTGACCIATNCTVKTEHDCRQSGGIYFGNGTTCIGGCNKNCTPAPNGMLGWWPLDQAQGGVTPNLADPATGGTLVGGPTAVPGEFVNGSYNFDGLTQHIVVPHHPRLDIGEGDFSIDCWVRTSAASGIAPILNKFSAGPVQGYNFYLQDGYPSLRIASGGEARNFSLGTGGLPGGFVADDAWHLVGVSVDRDDPAGVQFYVDGAPAGNPFDPTPVHGSLDVSAPLYFGADNPAIGAARFSGRLDEIEIIRRDVIIDDMARIFQAASSGKCPETCYVTRDVPCCTGLTSGSSLTICNYSLVPHTYSWGATPLNGGPGCGPQGPMTIFPNAGTLTVPAQGCVTIPLQVLCPSNVPVGTVACYQVSIFNHTTGRIFGCQGSVKRAGKWCLIVDVGDPIGIGITPVYPGISTPIKFNVENLGEPGTLDNLQYTIVPLSGDTDGDPSYLSLDGLPPGTFPTGSIALSGGQTGSISVDVLYDHPYLIGYDRLMVMVDDGTGVLVPLAEAAIRSVMPGTSSVPEPEDLEPGAGDGRLFLEVPNPFATSDRIRFRVAGSTAQEVKFRLFDLQGRAVKVFFYDKLMPPGEYTVDWNARDDRGQKLPSGIYFMKLQVGKQVETTKVLVRSGS